jgi:sucrose-6-phosphate hydrolase SacC (GH32 family)
MARSDVFGNHGQISMTNRFFPDPDNQKLSFFARKGDVEIIELEVNWLESIWQDFNARP